MSDFLQQLIAAEKAAMTPPAAAKQMTWSALESSIRAGVPPPFDLSPGASLPIAWLAGIIGVSGLAVVAYVATRPAIVAPAPPPPPPIVEVIEAPPPPPPPPVIEPPRKVHKQRSKPSFAMQIAELRKAQFAFSRGNAVQALELVEAHRAKYPKSPLEQERSALEALAACRTHRNDGWALARKFLEQWPQSPQADRVRRTCEF